MKKIGEIEKVGDMTRARFLEEYYRKKPVIIQNKMSHWHATKSWTPQYFKERYGDFKVWIDYFDPASAKSLLDQHIDGVMNEISLAQYVDSLASENRLYSLREDKTLFERFPQLVEECDYFAPFCCEEETLEDTYKGFWFGPKGHVTGLHIDVGEGLLFQFFGKKRWMFFAPDQTPNLYPEPREKLEDPELETWVEEEELEIWRKYMGWSQVNPLVPDYDRFPKLKQAQYREAYLEPGEVCYVPNGWWHLVESLSISISISKSLDEEEFLLSEEESGS